MTAGEQGQQVRRQGEQQHARDHKGHCLGHRRRLSEAQRNRFTGRPLRSDQCRAGQEGQCEWHRQQRRDREYGCHRAQQAGVADLAPRGRVAVPDPQPSGQRPGRLPVRLADGAAVDHPQASALDCGQWRRDHGIAEVTAAGLLALMGAFDLFGTVASGWLSDKYDNRYLLCVYYVLRVLSLLYLPVALGMDLLSVSLFAAFYGLDWFATLPPTIRITTDRFGAGVGPLVFGWMFVAHQIGASVAAIGAGLTRTLDGTYAPAFALSGILCIAAGFASLAIDGNRKKDKGVKTALSAGSAAA